MAISRARLLQWQGETPYGTIAGAWATTDCHLAYDIGMPSMKQTAMPRPQLHGTIGDDLRADIICKRTQSISFKPEMKGNAAEFSAIVFPDCHHWLQAAGFLDVYAGGDTSHTYTRATNPTTSACPSMAIRHFIGDSTALMHTILGARCNVAFDFVPGEILRPTVTATGLYTAPEDEAVVVPSYAADILPPIVQGLGWDPYTDSPTLGSWGQVRKLTLDLGANVVEVPSLSPAGSEGIGGVFIHGWNTKLTAEVEAKDGAAIDDWIARWASRTEATGAGLVITVGSAAHNQFIFTLGRCVPRTVTPADLDGAVGYQVDFQLMATAAATTNDSIIIKAT